jgi:hypothetical protein
MPYLLQTDRARLDPHIDKLADNMTKEQRAGELNYIINRLMLKLAGEGKYKDMNELMGAVECAKLEFYRRKAAPYEDKKAVENGDLNY